MSSLNPYLVGRWFRRQVAAGLSEDEQVVLILIWLEDGLEVFKLVSNTQIISRALILIWLEDGLEVGQKK